VLLAVQEPQVRATALATLLENLANSHTQLKGHTVHAHVAEIGHLTDIELDGHFVVSQGVEITTPHGVSTIIAPTSIHAGRTADDMLVLTVVQDQAGA
jgi:riboflavin synthase alpha subunit